jgi:hypothetical protein
MGSIAVSGNLAPTLDSFFGCGQIYSSLSVGKGPIQPPTLGTLSPPTNDDDVLPSVPPDVVLDYGDYQISGGGHSVGMQYIEQPRSYAS